MDESDGDGMPAVLLAELDTAIRLNDLLLVQDLLKVWHAYDLARLLP